MKIAMYIALFLCISMITIGIALLFMPGLLAVRICLFIIAVFPGIALFSIGIDLLKNWD